MADWGLLLGKAFVIFFIVFYFIQFLAVLRELFRSTCGYYWYTWWYKNSAPKDVVILHVIPRGKCIPNPSPFALKVETYLKRAQIPYELETNYAFGPLGKTPWISLNGVHVADSEAIIEFLAKKFEINDEPKDLTPERKALVQVVRIVIEESIFWGSVYWRFIGGFESTISKVMNINPFVANVVRFVMARRTRNDMRAHGLGRFPESEIYARTISSLRRVSLLLGSDLYFAGNLPSVDECGIFGLLAQMVYAQPGSPYETFIKDEASNLIAYCDRMKERYWKDWDEKCVTIYDERPARQRRF